MSTPTLARSATRTQAVSVFEVRYLNGQARIQFRSPELGGPVDLAIGEITAALHLSGQQVTAATTRREAAELVVRALVSLGLGAVRAVDQAARAWGAYGSGELPWSVARGDACTAAAWRLGMVLPELPAPGTSRPIDLD
ncbi:hypothetical protein ACVDFE_00880 [Lentzea chajnantorensis]